MENLLQKYMGKGLGEEKDSASDKRPVVTISREFGCPSKLIAQMLVDHLNKRPVARGAKQWRFINKEILESAAREFELKPADVQYLFNMGEKGLLEDFLISFSSVYMSNIKVKRTLIHVISQIAGNGNIVLVGRASAAILRGKPEALHVKLQAPAEWRIPEICKLRNIKADEAKKMMVDIDKKRTALYELILGKKIDPYLFDVVFNCSTLPMEQIVQGIIRMMETREMF